MTTTETAEGTCLQGWGHRIQARSLWSSVGSDLDSMAPAANSVGAELVSSQNWIEPAILSQGRPWPKEALQGA